MRNSQERFSSDILITLTVWKLGVVSCNFGNSVGKVGEVGGFKLAVSDAPGWK